MELDNSFTVPVPPEAAWDVLLDVQRIAPCMPGATVDEVDGDVVTGRIKVKLGPVSLTYRGTANFADRDATARTILVEAAGKEMRGSGTASATVRASLSPNDSDGTVVVIHTTLNVTGRPAQFGRGVMVDVSGKLIEQFATNLAAQLVAENGAAPNGAASASTNASGVNATGANGTDLSGAGSATAKAGSAMATDSAPAEARHSGGRHSGADTAEADAPDAGAAGTGAADSASPATGQAASSPDDMDHPPTAPSVILPPPGDGDEDSINLIRLVGPAILKRVIPAAVAAAGLALLVRRVLRRRGDNAS